MEILLVCVVVGIFMSNIMLIIGVIEKSGI